MDPVYSEYSYCITTSQSCLSVGPRFHVVFFHFRVLYSHLQCSYVWPRITEMVNVSFKTGKEVQYCHWQPIHLPSTESSCSTTNLGSVSRLKPFRKCSFALLPYVTECLSIVGFLRSGEHSCLRTDSVDTCWLESGCS
jgi:hypothetical protein